MWERLKEIEILGIKVDKDLEEKVRIYIENLFEWNQTTNLTSEDKESFLYKHVIFSYNFVPLIKGFRYVFDFGSGNGVPGIPLSFVFPEKKFILIENKKRKVAFLEYISSAVAKNVEVIDSSFQTAQEEYFSDFCVVTKAFNDFKVMKKFFRRSFELIMPSRSLKPKKGIEICEVFYPAVAISKDILFYKVVVR